MRIALGGGRAAAVLEVQQPLAALGPASANTCTWPLSPTLTLASRARVDHVRVMSTPTNVAPITWPWLFSSAV